MQRHKRLVKESIRALKEGVPAGVLEDELRATHEALCEELKMRGARFESLEPTIVWENDIFISWFDKLQNNLNT